MIDLARKALFALDPETAHHLAISGMSMYGQLPGSVRPGAGRSVRVFGREFANPVGLAAGLDKSAEAVLGFARLGFGFVEIGTVTPKAQPGNPKPRMFRLPEHDAIINRMGFNNDGADAVARRLARARPSLNGTIVGVNIGKNKVTPVENALQDYVSAMRTLYTHADYFVANLSSPNTPGLRSLQSVQELDRLCAALREVQNDMTAAGHPLVPFCIKVAPDLSDTEIDAISERLSDGIADGLVATNTTLERAPVAGHRHAEQAGGLSGAPVTGRALATVARFANRLPDSVPIIGVGGIGSVAQAQAMLDAGAVLVQIYTAFIYQGPKLVRQLVGAV